MKNLEDLFQHQLKDLYSAENQLIDALPTMVEKSHNSKLSDAFKSHLEETRKHADRLKNICESLGFSPEGETCNAMQGLIKEAKGFLKHDTSEEVRDAGLIADAQRIEHYEISGYGTAVRYARELGHEKEAEMLQETLNEEYEADNKLDKLAEGRINKEAQEV